MQPELGLSPSAASWIETAVGPGARVAAVYPQGGSTSSTLHRVEVSYHRQLRWLMLRRFTNETWLAEEPDLVMHEASNLETVQAAGIPTPKLIDIEPLGTVAGAPAILMDCLPGQVDLLPANMDDWLRQQAEVLLKLHALDLPHYPWHYAPYNDVTRLQVPPWTRFPRRWERAVELVNGPRPPVPDTFIHRDYHPVNILWQDGQISGIVDWPNACLGPAGIDVSWNRSNLASIYGVETADRFLHHYLAAGGTGYHPIWDLLVIIEILPGPPDVYPPWVEYGVQGLTDLLMLERLEQYLASVLARLGSLPE